MELREPPVSRTPSRPGGRSALIAWVTLVGVVAVLGVELAPRLSPPVDTGSDRAREVASRLKAAGLLDEASKLYAEYLADPEVSDETKARIAFALGVSYFDRGRYEPALRWFYEAEGWGSGSLEEELGSKIVASLERLGRLHAAQSAMDSRTRLASPDDGERGEADPVVARIGQEEIHLSQVEEAMDALPPEMRHRLQGLEERRLFLRKYVADELIWRRARRLEYDRDPEVRAALEGILKQLAVAKFLEREVVADIRVSEDDLRSFFSAQAERYVDAGSASSPTFEEVRGQVERDYRRGKVESAYEGLVAEELDAAGVELFPERMGG